MEPEPPTPPETQSATIEMNVAGRKLKMQISASTGPTRPVDLMPIFLALADAFAAMTVETVHEKGLKISCKSKCGACCRQLVPLSETEALHIGEVVQKMPEPRRSEIRARFASARQKLEEAGLLERLLNPQTISLDEFVPFALGYFRNAIACPFLEDESCSIYPDRPIVCREYLVTTPAENCRKLNPKNVNAVRIQANMRDAIGRLSSYDPAPRALRVPLILAPEWAEAHPDQSLPRPGTELVRDFFTYLGRQSGPEIESPAEPVPHMGAPPS